MKTRSVVARTLTHLQGSAGDLLPGSEDPWPAWGHLQLAFCVVLAALRM